MHARPGESKIYGNAPTIPGDPVRPLGREDPLERETGVHSTILAWRIPWTEEPGGLHSMGLQRVRHDLVNEQQEKGKQLSGTAHGYPRGPQPVC